MKDVDCTVPPFPDHMAIRAQDPDQSQKLYELSLQAILLAVKHICCN